MPAAEADHAHIMDGIAAQARARGHVVLGIGTRETGPGCFCTGPNRPMAMLAQKAWPFEKLYIGA